MDRYIIFVYGTADVCIMHGNLVYCNLMPNGITNGTNMSVAFKRAFDMNFVYASATDNAADSRVSSCGLHNLTCHSSKHPANSRCYVDFCPERISILIFNALSTASFTNVV